MTQARVSVRECAASARRTAACAARSRRASTFSRSSVAGPRFATTREKEGGAFAAPRLLGVGVALLDGGQQRAGQGVEIQRIGAGEQHEFAQLGEALRLQPLRLLGQRLEFGVDVAGAYAWGASGSVFERGMGQTIRVPNLEPPAAPRGHCRRSGTRRSSTRCVRSSLNALRGIAACTGVFCAEPIPME